MFGASKGRAPRKDHAACSGCSLCLLVCPLWRDTRDPRTTPEGRAKALQHGASAADIAPAVQACRLCGACEPVCPEEIDLMGLTLDLRSRIADPEAVRASQARMREIASRTPISSDAKVVFLPGPAMHAKPDTLARVGALLGAAACPDIGEDIMHAVVSGIDVPPERRAAFLAHLAAARTVVVEDGLWMRPLRQWIPRARLVGLGEALSGLDRVRHRLRHTDLYVIEPRAYHGDYERLVKHYDRLRIERGCAFNLDLQRIAIPAAGQAAWILKGRRVDRVVVERQEDALAFAGQCTHPVVHLAELADH